MWRPLLLVLACLALLAAGCGGDDQAEQPAAVAPAAPSGPGEVDVAQIGKDVAQKPVIALTAGDPPAELQSEDIVTGKGRAAKAGDTVSMQYVGVSWASGRQFDASWDRGEPFEFPLGGEQVIAGWDEGIVGMRPGGRRLLVIPPDKAYGEQAPSPDIAANDTLVFVVDLEKVG